MVLNEKNLFIQKEKHKYCNDWTPKDLFNLNKIINAKKYSKSIYIMMLYGNFDKEQCIDMIKNYPNSLFEKISIFKTYKSRLGFDNLLIALIYHNKYLKDIYDDETLYRLIQSTESESELNFDFLLHACEYKCNFIFDKYKNIELNDFNLNVIINTIIDSDYLYGFEYIVNKYNITQNYICDSISSHVEVYDYNIIHYAIEYYSAEITVYILRYLYKYDETDIIDENDLFEQKNKYPLTAFFDNFNSNFEDNYEKYNEMFYYIITKSRSYFKDIIDNMDGDYFDDCNFQNTIIIKCETYLEKLIKYSVIKLTSCHDVITGDNKEFYELNLPQINEAIDNIISIPIYFIECAMNSIQNYYYVIHNTTVNNTVDFILNATKIYSTIIKTLINNNYNNQYLFDKINKTKYLINKLKSYKNIYKYRQLFVENEFDNDNTYDIKNKEIEINKEFYNNAEKSLVILIETNELLKYYLANIYYYSNNTIEVYPEIYSLLKDSDQIDNLSESSSIFMNNIINSYMNPDKPYDLNFDFKLGIEENFFKLLAMYKNK